jgi:dinuclear metal center YbgI/SA1388 family protein
MTITRDQLTHYLTKLLKPELYQDYGPNGLQIEGTEEVKKIAFAVSATRNSINECIEQKADALIVHHGLFWKFHGVRTLTDSFGKRVLPLARHHVNLYSYHLPLDAHLECGNAATLAEKIGLTKLSAFGDHKGMPTGVKGVFQKPLRPCELKEKLEGLLDHQVLHSAPQEKVISSMGIITGGANGDWVHAQTAKLDAYLTGEMSEHDWHEAQEGGVHMFAGGHHATEKFGIQALQKMIEEEFSIETLYIDSPNPA